MESKKIKSEIKLWLDERPDLDTLKYYEEVGYATYNPQDPSVQRTVDLNFKLSKGDAVLVDGTAWFVNYVRVDIENNIVKYSCDEQEG